MCIKYCSAVTGAKDIAQMFVDCDANGDGHLDANELTHLLLMLVPDISAKELRSLMLVRRIHG
jgi:Ca2+-binding EF-hand superfamily protein